jgi:hypothetical protein
VSTDPYWANVVLLSHFDGPNNSVTFTDNSPSANSLSAVGDAKLATAQKRYGTASLAMDGSGDYAVVASSSNFDFGTSTDFTVEAWVYVITSGSSSTSANWLTTKGRKYYFGLWGGGIIVGNASVNIFLGSPDFTSYRDKWTHVAHTRSGSTHRVFIDGVLMATATSSASIGETNEMYIGNDPVYGPVYNGWIDEVRVTKGVARYTSNFTVPSSAYPDSDGNPTATPSATPTATITPTTTPTATATVTPTPTNDPNMPTFVAASTASNSSIAVPSGTTNGDFMVAFVGGFNPSTLTVPSGWTQVGSTLNWSSSQYSAALLYRVASSEPASYTFTSGGYNYGFIATYRGTSTLSIDVAGSIVELASGTSYTVPGITSSSGSILLSAIIDRDDVSLSAPAGMTPRVNSTSGVLWRVALADLPNANNGNRIWTQGSGQFPAAAVLVSLKGGG